MIPSSNGCLSTSSTSLGNSGSSSKKRIPLCARETSPGVKLLPPQIIETLEASMMHLSKRSLDHERKVFVKLPYNRINLTHFENFGSIQGGKNRRQCLTQKRLPTTRSTHHEQIVQSCCCDTERSFCNELPLNIGKIRFQTLLLRAELIEIFCITEVGKSNSL